ncbi:MAG: hypothetical protein OHK0012_18170 [Synechococcales cyanobacterium]
MVPLSSDLVRRFWLMAADVAPASLSHGQDADILGSLVNTYQRFYGLSSLERAALEHYIVARLPLIRELRS